MSKNTTGDNINLNDLKNIDFGPKWLKSENQSNAFQSDKKPVRKKHKSTKPRGRKNKETFSKRKDYLLNLKVGCSKKILEEVKKQIKKTGISFSISEINQTIIQKERHLTFKLEQEDSSIFFYEDRTSNRFYDSLESTLIEITKRDTSGLIEVSKKEMGKPSGNFSSVLQCHITKFILPPKNYHDFEKIIKDHIFLNNIKEEYSKFINKLELITEKSIIDEWTEKTIENLTYSVKSSTSGIQSFSTIEHLKSELSELKNNSFIRKCSSISVNGHDINKLSDPLKQFIKFKLQNTNNWKKDVFIQIIVFMKKNGFHVFKHGENKNLYVGMTKPKTIDVNSLSKSSIKILNLIKKNQILKKVDVFNHSEDLNFEKKFVLQELKWLTLEGYIREFSDGKISIS